MRKATTDDDIWAYIFSFQSPPSVRKATELTDALEELDIISIPAFREEGDYHVLQLFAMFFYFNPRLP